MAKKVIIIGAGITGLTAALRLIEQGYKVTVVEASQEVGGLAGSVILDAVPVERYYHFICREDRDLIKFISELDLADKLNWREAGTGFFINGKIYPFNTPLDLLKFDPTPFSQRLRFGIHIATSQFRKSWLGLDKIAAKPWLIARIGMSAYMAIWDPLLRIKFGEFHEQISAAWIWHRIQRVSRSRSRLFDLNSYGFLEQGCHTLMKRMLEKLSGSEKFSLILNKRVSKILIEHEKTQAVLLENRETIQADSIISTCAIPSFLKLVDSLGVYGANLASIKYLNIACVIFELDRPFSNNFWLNVNDPRVSFNGIVETTNLNPRRDLKAKSLIYIPYYMSPDDPRWGWMDEAFFNDYIGALKLINPKFSENWIIGSHVFRDVNAQAVCLVGFSEVIPAMRTPVHGLYMTDSAQYYPEDRTLSASVRLGASVAKLLTRDM
ncbi:MAG: NAD(P)/FAD-dependent oxidoreductase [Desulfomonilaceae bacterium]